ncbi:uncharacterized protein MCAP_0864-like isoform X2 [Ptychodera flava]|uniref:uncharacterized protein MCAP_0864-like isoform X2 n=1 Tax=Ptychodera flava TaxID=63121 RepID=UPI003969DF0C
MSNNITSKIHPASGKKRNQKNVPNSTARELEMANIQELLRSTTEELAQEKKLRQDLEEKYTELQVKHEAVNKSNEKHTRTLERFRNDNEKKSKQIELMQREQTYSEQRIKNLELRVSEVEKTENQLEMLREVLKSSQSNVRDRDNEIKSLKQMLDDVNKQLHSARESIQDLNTKVGDLNQQVRDEVKRNQAMEKELEAVPILEKELEETRETLEVSKKHLLERRAQLSLARQTIKDQRNKIQSLEAEVSTIPQLERELQMTNYEILTLKKLIIGKDSLVVQKTQELECMKEQLVGDTPWNKLYYATYPSGANLKVSDFDLRPLTPSYTMDPSNSYKNAVVLLDANNESKHSAHHRNAHSTLKPWTKKGEFQRQLSESIGVKETTSDKLQQDGHHIPKSPKRQIKTAIVRPNTVSNRSSTNETTESKTSYTFPSQNQSAKKRGIPKFSALNIPSGSLVHEEDWMRAQYIQFGDRVMVRTEEKMKQDTDEKAHLSGTVKFVGKIDKGHTDHRLYIGLRMDEPIGDTDGVINGKRYFDVMPRHGKIFKITDVISVLHPKSQSYKLLKECLREQRIESGKTKQYVKSDSKTLIRVAST